MSEKSSFSEGMRVHSDRTWNAILGHRFFREVATDAIDDRENVTDVAQIDAAPDKRRN